MIGRLSRNMRSLFSTAAETYHPLETSIGLTVCTHYSDGNTWTSTVCTPDIVRSPDRNSGTTNCINHTNTRENVAFAEVIDQHDHHAHRKRIRSYSEDIGFDDSDHLAVRVNWYNTILEALTFIPVEGARWRTWHPLSCLSFWKNLSDTEQLITLSIYTRDELTPLAIHTQRIPI